MIAFPNAKINLGLKITAKREDGYHFIQTFMMPVELYDALEFKISARESMNFSGINIPGSSSSNLVLKALNLLRKEYDIPPLKIHLHKNIPLGAGLGGGSSNGAFMLKMLNSYFRLGISEERLIQLASELGSDCPFFINNQPAMVSGIGEILTPYNLDLSGLYIILINPGFPVSTSEAYAGIGKPKESHDLKDILEQDISNWKSSLFNEFEKSIFKKFPELNKIKTELYQSGAVYASMSGSGSSIYGMFKESPEIGNSLKQKLIFSGTIKMLQTWTI